MQTKSWGIAIGLLALLCLDGGSAWAELYSFTNADGQYVVSQSRPEDRDVSYAILTDEGEFVRMVPGRQQQIPLSHWRPWYLPREPDPFGTEIRDNEPREPVITVEEDINR